MFEAEGVYFRVGYLLILYIDSRPPIDRNKCLWLKRWKNVFTCKCSSSNRFLLRLQFDGKFFLLNLERTYMYCPWRKRGGGWDLINRGLTRHIPMHVPSQDLDFQRHMSWYFFYVQWAVEMRGDCSFDWYCCKY